MGALAGLGRRYRPRAKHLAQTGSDNDDGGDQPSHLDDEAAPGQDSGLTHWGRRLGHFYASSSGAAS